MSKRNGHKKPKKLRRIAPVHSVAIAKADAELETLKKRFVEEIEKGTVSVTKAADAIKKAPITVWRWRKADPAFDAAVVSAYQDNDSLRVALVEDSYFSRLIGDTATPAEVIFYLKNRAPYRWRDKTDMEISVVSPDVRARISQTLEAVRELLPADQAETLLDRLEGIWR